MIWAGKIGKNHKKRTFFQFFLLSPLTTAQNCCIIYPNEGFGFMESLAIEAGKKLF